MELYLLNRFFSGIAGNVLGSGASVWKFAARVAAASTGA
jgi:hypothetical protein